MTKRLPRCCLATALLIASSAALPQPVPGTLDVHWNEGAKDCSAQPQEPIQVHRYDAQTFILRESLCATFEAPFIYLLVGSDKALLIDTGDVADAKSMPLAQTVMALLPGGASTTRPLLVVHTHGHLDHRAGDAQFQGLANVQVVPSDLAGVRSYFGFSDWPNGLAQIDLGDRIVDVIPAPGHHSAHVVFYDRRTALLLSGDFLLPGRLLVDDAAAYVTTAKRVADFVKDRPVSHVLGAHVELDADGNLFDWGSQHHPHEHALSLAKDDVLALPAAISRFNGFYTTAGGFTMMNSMRVLAALGIAALAGLAAAGIGLRRYLRKRKAARLQRATGFA